MSNIHPEFARFLARAEKEQLLQQRGGVFWLFGLSGSGKSTIAGAVERALHREGRMTTILDGDNLRTGVNQNLGFSDVDRLENVRRAAEIAKLLASQGILTLVSVITPLAALRTMAREIVGDDYHEVYIKASYQTCAVRDVKGLYAKAAAGEIKDFTGKGSGFEEPLQPDLTLDTEQLPVSDCVARLHQYISAQTTL